MFLPGLLAFVHGSPVLVICIDTWHFISCSNRHKLASNSWKNSISGDLATTHQKLQEEIAQLKSDVGDHLNIPEVSIQEERSESAGLSAGAWTYMLRSLHFLHLLEPQQP